jgi:hypothetical protein
MTQAEYERRFAANHRIEGFGVGVRQHMPCPFCAAADFMIVAILNPADAMARGATCRECHRSARFVFRGEPGAIAGEMVLTGGDDPPDFLPPMRRIRE